MKSVLYISADIKQWRWARREGWEGQWERAKLGLHQETESQGSKTGWEGAFMHMDYSQMSVSIERRNGFAPRDLSHSS